MAPYRVLVVDDSAFMRKIISDLIVQDSQFTIVATASNGMEAIAAVREHLPDVITMDLEMPQMNGLEALQLIMKEHPRPIIMLSGISEDNTRDTIKALQFGAFDFIRKPSAIGSDNIQAVGEQLLDKLRTAAFVKTSKELLSQRKSELTPTVAPLDYSGLVGQITAQRNDSASLAKSTASVRKNEVPIHLKHSRLREKEVSNLESDRKIIKPPASLSSRLGSEPSATRPSIKNDIKNVLKSDTEVNPASTRLHTKVGSNQYTLRNERNVDNSSADNADFNRSSSIKSRRVGGEGFRDIVAIGTSTGGPKALHEVICSLPQDFPAPVLVVQHMPPKFTKSLAQRLDSFSPLTVVEAEQGMRVKTGFVYVAPGGQHMELEKQDNGFVIRLGEQPQRNGHRPSVDVMFESLVPFHELNIHAVIMTGMGSDGAKGMKLLADQGAASLIAESEETCIVYGMPRSAVEAGSVRTVLPLGQISSELVKAINNIE